MVTLNESAPRQDAAAICAKFFLAPIADFLEDDTISEILVHGTDVICVERGGRIERTSRRFETEDDLLAAATQPGAQTVKEIAQGAEVDETGGLEFSDAPDEDRGQGA